MDAADVTLRWNIMQFL